MHHFPCIYLRKMHFYPVSSEFIFLCASSIQNHFRLILILHPPILFSIFKKTYYVLFPSKWTVRNIQLPILHPFSWPSEKKGVTKSKATEKRNAFYSFFSSDPLPLCVIKFYSVGKSVKCNNVFLHSFSVLSSSAHTRAEKQPRKKSVGKLRNTYTTLHSKNFVDRTWEKKARVKKGNRQYGMETQRGIPSTHHTTYTNYSTLTSKTTHTKCVCVLYAYYALLIIIISSSISHHVPFSFGMCLRK